MNIEKLKSNLLFCIENKVSKNEFEKTGKVGIGYFSNSRFNLNKQLKEGKLEEEEFNEIIDLYNQLDGRKKHEQLESEDHVETYIERDSEHKITGYSFKIYKRNKTPLVGNLTREEMNDIYHLYSYYGTNLTQREVSRHFPDMSLMDFKRVRNAFIIYKDSAPFAPHMIEEKTIDELRDIQLREKENDFLKKIEEGEVKNNKKLVREYALENIKLKQQISDITNIDVSSLNKIEPFIINTQDNGSKKSIMVHLSDLHIGAKCESGTVYENEWNANECERRLSILASKIINLGNFDTIIINLLGDMLDGMDNQTARRDHYMPQQMDNLEQVKSFINLMTNFTAKLLEICPDVKYYSVKCGNHDGIVAYTTTLALKHLLHYTFGVELTLFDTFFGNYKVGTHTYVICHGKDEKFMKRGLPLNLDDKSRAIICDWLEDNNIHGSNIHIVKGDLHSDNYNSSKKLDYRNVLSLFGGSDYSNYNYVRNNYGLSYDIITSNQNIIRGSFINL